MYNTAAASGGGVFIASGISTISFNRIAGNTASSGRGIAASASVTATNDWWGCNGGPGQSGCDTTADTAGTVTASPYLELTLGAAPSTVATGGSATATASLTENSAGSNTSSQGHVPDGAPVAFRATLGTMSRTSGSTTSGAAAATFTAGASTGSADVTATVDDQSANASLTVGSPPSVTSQPADQTVAAGQTATFTAAAGGSPARSVQWQVSADGGTTWSAVGGATATTFGLAAQASDSGDEYRAAFSNPVGTAYSNAVTLTIALAPAVTAQPANQTVTAGQTATFTAAASGSPAPTVQWQVSTDGGATWIAVGGATTTTFSLTAEASDNGNQYQAVFTNGAGSAESNAATQTVQVAPSVTSQPANQTVTAGQTASFTAAASGPPTPTVQWQVSTDGGATWTAVRGATSTTFSLIAGASQSGYQYRAVFTNAATASCL